MRGDGRGALLCLEIISLMRMRAARTPASASREQSGGPLKFTRLDGFGALSRQEVTYHMTSSISIDSARRSNPASGVSMALPLKSTL